jgi:hypothetical protein
MTQKSKAVSEAEKDMNVKAMLITCLFMLESIYYEFVPEIQSTKHSVFKFWNGYSRSLARQADFAL